ncbi:MAG: malectin domain-containing carbohydrate-binding protein [Bryobacteraceae bacterium]
MRITAAFAVLIAACGLELAQAQTAGLDIPAAHPRLWFTPGRLAQARAWYASNPFTPSSSDYIGQAFRYLMTGETQYARSAIAHAVSVTAPDLAANSPDPYTGVASDTARWEGEIVILTYDWCYDQMTPAERTTVRDRWNFYINNLRQKPWGGPTMPQSNYYWGYLRNEFEWAIATWGESAMAETFLNHALSTRWQNSFVPHALTGGLGGVFQEGSGYGRALAEYSTVPLISSALMGRDLTAESSYFRDAVFYMIYATPPARTALRSTGSLYWELFPFADDERFIDGGNASAGSWAQFMWAMADKWRDSGVGKYARRWINMVGSSPSRFVRAVDRGGQELPFSQLALDYYAPGPGYLYGRNNWNPQSTVFQVQLSEAYDEGHGHDDMGNWQIWRNGRWLSRESTGYAQTLAGFAGSGTVETTHPLAHNSLLVNQRGYALGERNGRPIVKRIHSGTHFSFGAVDITPPFRNNLIQYPHPERENAEAVHVEREYLFIRPLETMLVFDRVLSATASVPKTFLAHFERQPVADGTNSWLAVNGDQALRVTTLLPANPVQRVITEGGAIGQYRLESETSGALQSYMLHVMQARDAAGQNVQAQVTDTGSAYVVTLQHPTLGFARVQFAKGSNSSGGGVAYSASALPGTVEPLLDRIQGISMTDDGPQWESIGAPPPPDTTLPVVAITSPSAGQTLSGSFTASAAASDNVGVTGVQFLVDGVAYGAEDTLAPYSVSVTGLGSGAHTVSAVARDAAGNTANAAVVSFTVVETLSVAVTSPSAGQTLSSGSFTATASASGSVLGVQFVIDGVNYGAEDTAAPYSMAVSGLASGAHTIAAVARGSSTSVTSATVNFSVATAAVTVAVTSPTAGQALSSGSFTATASTTGAVLGVQFVIDGANYGAEDTAALYSVAVSGLAPGAHTIAARARHSGGTATSATVSFTVSTPTTFSPIRVNAGGPAYTDPSGNAWSADRGFTGGYTFQTTVAISNTTTPKLYQSERLSDRQFYYRFQVPNGTYSVKLKFAEIYHRAAGKRVMNVRLNGTQVETNLDVFAASGGFARAIDRVHTVNVTNGVLEIRIVPVVDDGKINAFEITQQ